MLIFSHRGNGFGLKENTLHAFQKALISGFSVEIDIQKTLNDQLVIYHDLNLKKINKIDKNLKELSFKELKGRAPSFDDFCKLFKKYKLEGQLVALHIKDENQGHILELLVNCIQKYNIEKDCLIFDLTLEGTKKIKKLEPKISIGLSIGEKRYSKTIYLWEDVKDFKKFDIVWWDEWESGLYTKQNAEAIKATDKKIFAISPELHRLHAHPNGADLKGIFSVCEKIVLFNIEGICTDFPLKFRDFLNI